MTRSITRVTADIPAPAAQAYGILADYRVGHPSILPKAAFAGLDVIEGGYGAGTVIDAHLKRGGRTETLRLTVTEPEPGRVLREAAPDGTVTTFTVDPRGSQACSVTLETQWPDRNFIRGILAKAVYRAELRNLAKAVKSPMPTI